MIGGPSKVLSIPKGRRSVSSICRHLGRGCPSTAKPVVMRQLSVTASKLLLITGAGRMRRRLRTRFRGEDVGGQCVTLLSKYVARARRAAGRAAKGAEGARGMETARMVDAAKGTKEVRLPLYPGPLSQPYRDISRRRKGRTVARCRVVAGSRGRAHVTFYPLAKHARRLHMRTTRPGNLGYPVLNSRLCKGGTSELCLRTRCVRFHRPVCKSVVYVRGRPSFWRGSSCTVGRGLFRVCVNMAVGFRGRPSCRCWVSGCGMPNYVYVDRTTVEDLLRGRRLCQPHQSWQEGQWRPPIQR